MYVEAPFAVSVVEPPTQIRSLFTVTVGVVLTVTVEVAVAVQPAAVAPVTVYIVEAVGLAVTVEPVVALRPVEGLQL